MIDYSTVGVSITMLFVFYIVCLYCIYRKYLQINMQLSKLKAKQQELDNFKKDCLFQK